MHIYKPTYFGVNDRQGGHQWALKYKPRMPSLPRSRSFVLHLLSTLLKRSHPSKLSKLIMARLVQTVNRLSYDSSEKDCAMSSFVAAQIMSETREISTDKFLFVSLHCICLFLALNAIHALHLRSRRRPIQDKTWGFSHLWLINVWFRFRYGSSSRQYDFEMDFRIANSI